MGNLSVVVDTDMVGGEGIGRNRHPNWKENNSLPWTLIFESERKDVRCIIVRKN